MTFNLPFIKNKSKIQNNFNRQSYIDDAFSNFLNEIASFSYPTLSSSDRVLSPRTDIIENDLEYRLELELPGVLQDDIDIKVDSNILTIEGNKEKTSENKDLNYHMQERYYGSFYRSISLPSNVNEEHIEAKFKDGILQIKIPKKEHSTAKKIKLIS